MRNMIELWVKWRGDTSYKMYTMLGDADKVKEYYKDLTNRGHRCMVFG
jgi:hypothetical protein